MPFEVLYLYTGEGECVGATIHKVGSIKTTTHIWTEEEYEELEVQIASLRENEALSAVWPTPQDDEVVALLNDPAFEPVETTTTEVIDEEASDLVYSFTEHGEEIDFDRSDIYYTTREVVNPSSHYARIEKACGVVARKRVDPVL